MIKPDGENKNLRSASGLLLPKVVFSWVCRAYLLGLFYVSFREILFQPALHVGFFGIIAIMFWYRFKKKREPMFVPDPILFCLPFFWAFNSLLIRDSMVYNLVMPQMILFTLSLLLIGPKWLASPYPRHRLSLGILFSAYFYFGFLSGLKLIFTPFELHVFQKIVLSGFFFYTCFPLAQTTFAEVAFIGVMKAGDIAEEELRVMSYIAEFFMTSLSRPWFHDSLKIKGAKARAIWLFSIFCS